MNRTLFIALACVVSLSALCVVDGTIEAQSKKRKKSKPHADLAKPEKAVKKAPPKFKVRVFTTQGKFDVLVVREWAPLGADRFYNLVRVGFFDDTQFFRVIKGFMAQFGIHGNPVVTKAWMNAKIKDDKVKKSNKRGMLSFATSGKDSRTTQLFINFKDNTGLDAQGFSPFAQVLGDGMKVVDKLHSGYGEGAPRGAGPSQAKITAEGNAYLKKEFPKLDSIQAIRLIK